MIPSDGVRLDLYAMTFVKKDPSGAQVVYSQKLQVGIGVCAGTFLILLMPVM